MRFQVPTRLSRQLFNKISCGIFACAFATLAFPNVVMAADDDAGDATKTQAETIEEAEEERQRLLVLELTGETVPKAERKTLSNLIGIEVANAVDFDVVTTQELEKLLTVETDKQLLGCLDASCLAEVADAMGTDLIIFGEIGKLGSTYVLTLSLFDSNSARASQRDVVKATSLDEVVEGLAPSVRKLTAGLKAAGSKTVALSSSPDGNTKSVDAVDVEKSAETAKEETADDDTGGVSVGGGGLNYFAIGGWSLVGVGVLVTAVTLTFDIFAESSRNGRFEWQDAGYFAGELAGIGIAAGGVSMALLPGLFAENENE